MAALYLISGMVGAGKTTLACQLAAERGALRLSPDEGIRAIAGDPGDRREVDALRDIVDSWQWRVARQALRDGEDVICENGFWRRTERLSRLRAARRLGARVELHFLDIGLDTLLERVRLRNRDPANTSFVVSAAEVRRWFGRLERPRADERRLYDRCVVYR